MSSSQEDEHSCNWNHYVHSDPNWVSFILGSHQAIMEAIMSTYPGAALAQVLLTDCHLVITLVLPNYSLAPVKWYNILQVSEVSPEVQVNT